MTQWKKKIASARRTVATLACCTAMLIAAQRILAQQTPANSAPSTPPAASTSPWSIEGINFSGLIDGYYNFNANHPPASSNGNQLRNFDYNANTFSLNMAKLTISHDPAPVGFRLDLGFGKAFNQILSSEPDFKHLEQAYVGWKPTGGKGFEADFGEFVTSAGAEVIETKDNWNYSRSLLFSLAIPYYHVGLRTSMPITRSFTGGVQIVNGWNNFSDNNSGKTIGLNGSFSKPKFTLNMNYYVGPENNNTNKGYRNLIDTTLLLTPVSKLSAYINYDYGQNRNAEAIDDSANPRYKATTLSHWQGVAAAVRYQATKKTAFASRFEYYKDESGFTTGLAQNLNEVTLTGEYKIPEGLLARIEYRRDNSDQLFFAKGTRTVHSQSTLEAGVVAFFGTK